MILIVTIIITLLVVAASSGPTNKQRSKPSTREQPQQDISPAKPIAPEPTPSPDAKVALAEIHASKVHDGEWMRNMRRKYPVRSTADGKTEVYVTDVTGHTYTCPCSPNPDAEELCLIANDIAFRQKHKMYA